MSADNWAVCPKCLGEAKEQFADLEREVRHGYGKMPLEEFDRLRKEVAAGIDMESLRTFREDYEIYNAVEGVIKVVYSGHCDKCGTGLDFKHQEPIFVGGACDPAVERCKTRVHRSD